MFRDGPLRRRPREEIRYGTGKSAVGPLLVASSDKGIVTIMVREKADQLLRDIRARFPKADLVRDEKGCAPIVAKVIRYIASPFGPFKLRLDIRGSAEGLEVMGRAPMAAGATLEPDELSDQVLAVVTDRYSYDVVDGEASFRMTRAARSSDE